MSPKGTIAIVAFAVLLILAPIAMAIAGCSVMGAMCEGPCGASSCAVLAPALAVVPHADVTPLPRC